MADDTTDPDGAAHWVTAVADGVRVAIDPEQVDALVERLQRRSGPFGDELLVEEQAAGAARELAREEIRSLIDDASITCEDVVGRSPTVLDADEFEHFAQSAALLSTIWALAFQAEEPEGAARAAELGWLQLIGTLATDCEEMLFSSIRPRRSDGYKLRLGLRDRDAVADAVAMLRELMATDDPAVSRLFPSAYGNDAERNAGWDVLMRGELIEKRSESLDAVERLIADGHGTADDLDAFMRCMNDARLVIGTRLDLSEDAEILDVDRDAVDPDDWEARVAYVRLTHLVGMTVEALTGTL